MSEAVGFIGVGAMGAAMASRLVDAQKIYVNDSSCAAAERLVDKGATFGSLEDIGVN